MKNKLDVEKISWEVKSCLPDFGSLPVSQEVMERTINFLSSRSWIGLFPLSKLIVSKPYYHMKVHEQAMHKLFQSWYQCKLETTTTPTIEHTNVHDQIWIISNEKYFSHVNLSLSLSSCRLISFRIFFVNYYTWLKSFPSVFSYLQRV